MHARASQRRSVNTLSILSTYRTCSQRVSLEPDKSFRMVPELLSVLGRALKLSQEGRLCVCCRDGGVFWNPHFRSFSSALICFTYWISLKSNKRVSLT